ncbi:MAG: hypothetical protein HY748_11030 [Elusimicrobia bacterium]|nr:hypothetical protein [Elusimicrobiota bacterium]
MKDLKNHLSMFFKSRKPIVATDRGRPAYFLVPYEDMVELIEMLDEAKDAELVKLVKTGRQAYARGGWIPVSGLWKKLGA